MMLVTPALKKRLKNKLKLLRAQYYRTFRSYNQVDLSDRLKKLGLGPGDVVLVHVAFNKFLGFKGKAYDIVTGIEAIIGDSGTLLLPSTPFSASAYDYVKSSHIFDVRRTPSKMGMVTELFRRTPGVIRSLHPTHPVLAKGRAAAELTCDHIKAITPCGKHSPYEKLISHNGKILLLGTGIKKLTFFHTLQELFESNFPRSPLTDEVLSISFKGYDGEELSVSTRLYNNEVSAKPDLAILEKALKNNGCWNSTKIASLEIVLLDVREIYRTFKEYSEE